MYTWHVQRTSGPTPGRRGLRGLDRVAGAASILEAMRATGLAASEAAADASLSPSSTRRAVVQLSAQAEQTEDALLAIAAVHALARVRGPEADRALVEIVVAGLYSLPEHAAWQAFRRMPSAELLDAMVRRLAAGGLAGMHAQSTLALWAKRRPVLIAAALRAALRSDVGVNGRRHVVETLGLVPERMVARDLAAIAADPCEADTVRAVAVAGLEDGSPRLPSSGAAGLTVAQIHLGAELDATLERSGMGDTGGVATLLVKLGTALANTPGIGRVVTIGRSGPAGAGQSDAHESGPGHQFASVALADDEGVSFADPWPARIAARRGLRRVFSREGRPDVVHLRMADVGTLAAAELAVELGIQTVFSLAPDPHALVAAREASGALDRTTFGAEDARTHLWYRADLVERLARQSDQVVLFPRDRLAEQMRSLVGFDVVAERDRFNVVPEGIDVAHIRSSVAARDTAALAGNGSIPESKALTDLLERLAHLPPSRHGLPIVLSVGRLNEVKGMTRLVEAFAMDHELRARATLVVVGGNLDDPTTVEAEELARIEATMRAHPEVRNSVVLLGHRPNGQIADLLGAARHGAGPLMGAGGAYACASRKEEFGLAIVEALAAGLPVVAPIEGGPATYVEHGKTGYLVDTTRAAALARGVADALDLSGRPGRAEHAAETIARRYDISEMAGALAEVYRGVHASRVEQRLAS